MPTLDVSCAPCCTGTGCCPTFNGDLCVDITNATGTCTCLGGLVDIAEGATGFWEGDGGASSCPGTGNPCDETHITFVWDSETCTGILSLTCCGSVIEHSVIFTESDFTCDESGELVTASVTMDLELVMGEGCCDGSVTITITNDVCA